MLLTCYHDISWKILGLGVGGLVIRDSRKDGSQLGFLSAHSS